MKTNKVSKMLLMAVGLIVLLLLAFRPIPQDGKNLNKL